jgi:hypothetical protein
VSYILIAATDPLDTPVSIANGGTSASSPELAMTALSTAAFSVSSQKGDWGQYVIIPPVGESPLENQNAITNLINTLITLGVLQ